jgi:hypothetical protein
MKIKPELEKLQELENAAKEQPSAEIFNRVDWNNTKHNFKSVLNECAFDISLEFKASFQRNLHLTRKQIYDLIAELFHQKLSEYGT